MRNFPFVAEVGGRSLYIARRFYAWRTVRAAFCAHCTRVRAGKDSVIFGVEGRFGSITRSAKLYSTTRAVLRRKDRSTLSGRVQAGRRKFSFRHLASITPNALASTVPLALTLPCIRERHSFIVHGEFVACARALCPAGALPLECHFVPVSRKCAADIFPERLTVRGQKLD